jgi:hypothetical protein
MDLRPACPNAHHICPVLSPTHPQQASGSLCNNSNNGFAAPYAKFPVPTSNN